MSQRKFATKAKASRAKSRPQATRKARGGSAPKASKANPRNVRAGSKQEAMLVLLKQPSGATIASLMKASGWQQHSVRGFLAGVVHKRLKLTLDSTKKDGARVYRIVGGSKPASPPLSDVKQAQTR
jgi:hypothetical protein